MGASTAMFHRARKCFAHASSTAFPCERQTAIDRGIAIAVRGQFDLACFDIPGRQPARSEFAEALRSLGETLDRAAAVTGAAAAEPIYNAKRRNFDRAAAEARARDARR